MWPTWTTPTITEVEIEPVTATLTPTVPHVANIMGIDSQTFKSLDKLLRISALCLKFYTETGLESIAVEQAKYNAINLPSVCVSDGWSL